MKGDEGALRLQPFELRMLLLLSFTAGVLDATTFLGLDKVFVANMTGNVVLLGVALFSPDLTLDGPLVALAAFVAGAALTARLDLSARSPLDLFGRTFAIEALLLVPAIVLAIGYDGGDDPRRLLILAALGAAMGARNETMREVGIAEVATTAQTVRVATIAAEEARGARFGPVERRRIAAVVALFAGAALGAALAVETELVWALLTLLAIHLLAGTVLLRRRSGST